MRLLITEDNTQLRGYLARTLASDGYETEQAGDGLEALAAAGEAPPDLMLLDLDLPGCGGLEVLRALRAGGARFPVMVLTGRAELDAKVECLEAGADDYVVKPFAVRELRARCKALLRRGAWSMGNGGEARLSWGVLELDRARRTVAVEGGEVELTGREFRVLEALVVARGRAVGRAELLEGIWGRTEATTVNLVDVYVSALRRKLGGLPVKIQAVRGEGYRLVGAPVMVPEAQA